MSHSGKEALEAAVTDAVLAGFEISGEGWNGEYGGSNVLSSASFVRERDKAVADVLLAVAADVRARAVLATISHAPEPQVAPTPVARSGGIENLKRYRVCWSNPDGGTATLIEHPEGEFVAYDAALRLLETGSGQ